MFDRIFDLVYFLIHTNRVIVEYNKHNTIETCRLYTVSPEAPIKPKQPSHILSKNKSASGCKYTLFIAETNKEFVLGNKDSDTKEVIEATDRLIDILIPVAQKHKAKNIKTYQELQLDAFLNDMNLTSIQTSSKNGKTGR